VDIPSKKPDRFIAGSSLENSPSHRKLPLREVCRVLRWRSIRFGFAARSCRRGAARNWHGCPIHATWPKNNADFWRTKILTNQKRDLAVTRELKRAGWRVLRIWEHALARKHEARTVGRLRRALGRNNAARSPEPRV
jgi:hypothetical protein